MTFQFRSLSIHFIFFFALKIVSTHGAINKCVSSVISKDNTLLTQDDWAHTHAQCAAIIITWNRNGKPSSIPQKINISKYIEVYYRQKCYLHKWYQSVYFIRFLFNKLQYDVHLFMMVFYYVVWISEKMNAMYGESLSFFGLFF